MNLKRILIILGIFSITIGVSMSVIKNDDTKEQKKEDAKEEKILIDTSTKEGDFIENSNYKSIELIDTKEVYFYDYNLNYKNKYIFQIPNQLNEFALNKYSQNHKNDFLEINAQVYEDSSVEKLNEKLFNRYSETTFNYSKNNNIKNISEYNVSYIFIQSIDENNTYKETFQVYVEITPSKIVAFDFTSKNRKFSDKTLNDILNGIKIEKYTENYQNSKIDGEYLVGSLKQIHPLNNKLYNVSYKIDKNKYVELENSLNSYDYVLFKSLKNDNIHIELEMFYDTKDLKVQVEDYIKSKIEEQKIISINSEILSIDDKEYKYYTMETKDKDNKINYHFSYVYFIDTDFCYIISFDLDNKEINNIIYDFTNFEVNES